jgi:lipid-binding SYLF domain-containing protein
MELRVPYREDGEMKTGKTEIYQSSIILISLFIVTAVMLGFASESVWAETDQEIESSVHACLGHFNDGVIGGREMLAMAKGVLVMPSLVKSDLIVGGEYGEGALRVGGETESYYTLAPGSIRSPIGAQANDFVILFMTDEALKQFQASKGWEVGVDGSVALAKFGGGNRVVDLIRMNDPIIVFVFDVKGQMADISLKGAKFSKINTK